mgnify:CR=1 FL=1
MGASQLALGAISCAVSADKRAWCWGKNIHGQAGNGGGSRFPTLVTYRDGTPLESVERLITNYAGVCAYLSDGSVHCWGRNSESQLPVATSTNLGYPTAALELCPQ